MNHKTAFHLIILAIVLSILACSSEDNAADTTGTEKTIQNSTVEQIPLSDLGPEDTLTPTSTGTPTPIATLVFTGNANVRTGPGLGFKPTTVMKAGASLPVYGRNEDGTWLLVDPIYQLWVHVSVVNTPSDISALPIAPTITPTSTRSMPPTSTVRPSQTPLPAVLLLTIYENLDNMTEFQFSDYKKEIVGKPIRENVVVGNVSDDGKVIISGPWSPIVFNMSDFCVVVTGVPKDVALQQDGGDVIYLEAKINGIVGNYNYYYNCENTLLLNYVAIGEAIIGD